MTESKAGLEKHFDNLSISDAANEEIVSLTSQYPNLSIYMREQPARALRIRDGIASQFVSRRQSRPHELDKLEGDLAALDAQPEASSAGSNETASKRRRDIESRIKEVTQIWLERTNALSQAYLEKRRQENGLEELRRERNKQEEKLKSSLRDQLGRDPSERDLAATKRRILPK